MSLINLMKIEYFKVSLPNIYELSLLISFKAFLPSLRVLKISQERKEVIRMVREIREIKVVLELLTI